MRLSQRDKNKTTFQNGQEIVYPLQGVGVIQSIENRDFQGQQMLYYVIYLE
ncbi:MAG: CarD family transcriptional regulator, partial [Spirochaetaceae bacterium]